MRTKTHRIIRRAVGTAERQGSRLLLQQLTETVKIDLADIALKPGD
ncbi:hypothetical protein MZC49_19000 [Yersinia pestis subsp. pestis]|nr:hypothetical protein [Yersinia pestis]MCV6837125.1 hypothetical protein [Yersinia pestis subsp. pestis]QOW13530.1 hypothetical protein S96127_1225 [Yersinia pestis]